MSPAYELISRATDRFYPISAGLSRAHSDGCREHLAKHLASALARHGLPTHVAERAEQAPDSVCLEVYQMGVTALEIAAACALAEQDYLRSKAR
jgi:hypothetical protein